VMRFVSCVNRVVSWGLSPHFRDKKSFESSIFSAGV
jgi:hypothetical protein